LLLGIDEERPRRATPEVAAVTIVGCERPKGYPIEVPMERLGVGALRRLAPEVY
jgi:hypothetical protein